MTTPAAEITELTTVASTTAIAGDKTTEPADPVEVTVNIDMKPELTSESQEPAENSEEVDDDSSENEADRK